MRVLAVIAARAGSRGVPGKNVRMLLGRPVVSYTLDAALSARRVEWVAVTTDDRQVMEIGRQEEYAGRVVVVERPGELAGDAARIDGAMRHCVEQVEERVGWRPGAVALLYANVPVRAEGVIDRAIAMLEQTGADSVQSVAEVGKFHPYWLYEVGEGGAARKYIENQVYRRQELPPLYSIDGAVGVVRTAALMAAAGSGDPHAFWGADRRALVQGGHETVDIDSLRDFYLAEAALRERRVTADYAD